MKLPTKEQCLAWYKEVGTHEAVMSPCIANMMKLKEQEMFKVTAADTKDVKVKF